MNGSAHPAARILALLITAIGSAGCPDDAGRDGSASESVCDGYRELARDVGCSEQPECADFKPDCEAAGRAWLACVRKDLAQCICESGGDLNCEGSFKPNEGPARCIDEYRTFDVCLEN